MEQTNSVFVLFCAFVDCFLFFLFCLFNQLLHLTDCILSIDSNCILLIVFGFDGSWRQMLSLKDSADGDPAEMIVFFRPGVQAARYRRVQVYRLLVTGLSTWLCFLQLAWSKVEVGEHVDSKPILGPASRVAEYGHHSSMYQITERTLRKTQHKVLGENAPSVLSYYH